MKRPGLILLVAVQCALLAACGVSLTPDSPTPTSTPVPMSSYADPDSGVQLQYPDYWKIQPNTSGGQKQMMIVTPNQNTIFIIQATDCPEGTPMFDRFTDEQMNDYAAEFWNAFKPSLGSFSISGDAAISNTTLSGRKFITYTVNGTSKENSKDYVLSFSIGMYGGKVYCIGYTKQTDASPSIQGMLDNMLASVYFAAPAATATPQAAAIRPYRNESDGISLQYPADWQANESTAPDGSPVTVIIRSDSKLVFYMNVVRDKYNIKPYDQCSEDEMKDETEKAGQAMLTSLKKTFTVDGDPASSITVINGKKFVTVSFAGSMAQTGQKAQVVTYGGYYYGYFYMFFTVNLDQSISANQSLLDAIANSVDAAEFN